MIHHPREAEALKTLAHYHADGNQEDPLVLFEFEEIKTAIETEGPTFINAMSACTTEWRFPSNQTIEMSDLAVDSLVFPLYEIINGRELRITYRPKNVIPVRDYLGGPDLYTLRPVHCMALYPAGSTLRAGFARSAATGVDLTVSRLCRFR